MAANEKIFRVVEEDVNKDGKTDLTIQHGNDKIMTFYGWKSMALQWACTTAALFVAGMGVGTFGL